MRLIRCPRSPRPLAGSIQILSLLRDEGRNVVDANSRGTDALDLRRWVQQAIQVNIIGN